MVMMDTPPSPPTPDAQAFGMLALDFARVLAVLAGTDALSLRHDIDPAGRYALTATPGNAMDKTGRPLRHAIFRILHGMCARHRNINVVGDDAQSIYSFRAADIKNILDFP